MKEVICEVNICKFKGEMQRENKLISCEREFKMPEDDMYIAGIGQAVLELLSFKVGSENHQKVFLSFSLVKLSKSQSLKLKISRTAWTILMILVSFCRILNGISAEINLFWRCSSPLRILRPLCLFKSNKFYEEKFHIIFSNWYSTKSTNRHKDDYTINIFRENHPSVP